MFMNPLRAYIQIIILHAVDVLLQLMCVFTPKQMLVSSNPPHAQLDLTIQNNMYTKFNADWRGCRAREPTKCNIVSHSSACMLSNTILTVASILSDTRS